MKELYEKFYEHSDLKTVRDLLDSEDLAKISDLVASQSASFTDYLNFFEFLAYLMESRQIEEKDTLGIFDYYLRNLRKYPVVSDYIKNSHNGFEKLTKVLKDLK